MPFYKAIELLEKYVKCMETHNCGDCDSCEYFVYEAHLTEAVKIVLKTIKGEYE